LMMEEEVKRNRLEDRLKATFEDYMETKDLSEKRIAKLEEAKKTQIKRIHAESDAILKKLERNQLKIENKYSIRGKLPLEHIAPLDDFAVDEKIKGGTKRKFKEEDIEELEAMIGDSDPKKFYRKFVEKSKSLKNPPMPKDANGKPIKEKGVDIEKDKDILSALKTQMGTRDWLADIFEGKEKYKKTLTDAKLTRRYNVKTQVAAKEDKEAQALITAKAIKEKTAIDARKTLVCSVCLERDPLIQEDDIMVCRDKKSSCHRIYHIECLKRDPIYHTHQVNKVCRDEWSCPKCSYGKKLAEGEYSSDDEDYSPEEEEEKETPKRKKKREQDKEVDDTFSIVRIAFAILPVDERIDNFKILADRANREIETEEDLEDDSKYFIVDHHTTTKILYDEEDESEDEYANEDEFNECLSDSDTEEEDNEKTENEEEDTKQEVSESKESKEPVEEKEPSKPELVLNLDKLFGSVAFIENPNLKKLTVEVPLPLPLPPSPSPLPPPPPPREVIDVSSDDSV